MAGQEPPVSVAHAALAEALDRKLTKWARIGRAPEYFRLERRGPYKQTLMHELNRFGGQMGPYVDSQLQLRSVDYINASPIDNLGVSMPRFVATMCPKCSTFAHFWSMIWELRSKVIINLTHENDRVGSGTTDKREQYWPPFDKATTSAANTWPVQPRTLSCETCSEVVGLRRFRIELTSKQEGAAGGTPSVRIVTLFWYSRWEDFPNSSSIGSRQFYANASNVLHVAMHTAQMLIGQDAVDDAAGDDAAGEDAAGEGGEVLDSSPWAVCHCSAGVGRTGTFVALVKLLRELELGRVAERLEAFDKLLAMTIEAMRERRLWMVKTDTEFATIHAAFMQRLLTPRVRDFALSWEASCLTTACAGRRDDVALSGQDEILKHYARASTSSVGDASVETPSSDSEPIDAAAQSEASPEESSAALTTKPPVAASVSTEDVRSVTETETSKIFRL